MYIWAILAVAGQVATAFPPAISFSPYKLPGHLEHRLSICKYCLCDQHQRAVICTGNHILINTVHLPPWATVFHIHNVTLPRMPHFGYTPSLKVLRINHAELTDIHPLSFVPLPNLETVHLADNRIDAVAETLFGRLDRLRIVNLARNNIHRLDKVELQLPEGLVLEQLVLDGNPLENGLQGSGLRLPLTRQLHLAEARLSRLNGTHILFEPSTYCKPEACRTVEIPSAFWTHIVTADFSRNHNLTVDPSMLPLLANLTALNLALTHVPASLATLFHPEANLRHLDLNGAHLGSLTSTTGPSTWNHCTSKLEWLDISHLGLKRLRVGPECTSLQWLFASGNLLEITELRSNGLRILHLDHNKLTEWPFALEHTLAGHVQQLETLSLAHNRLAGLPSKALAGFPSLTTLDLSHNRLIELMPVSFPPVEVELRYLNLSANLLRKFPALVLPNLQVLDLTANDISSEGIDMRVFEGLPLLQHLHLAKNPGVLDFCTEEDVCWLHGAKNLDKLVELDLSECQVRRPKQLGTFVHLQSLNLANNELRTVDFQDYPPNLVHLNLRGNRLHSIGNLSHVSLVESLQDLDLAENPLHCDCSLFDVLALLRRQAEYADRSRYYCFAENWQHPLKSYLDSAEHFCASQIGSSTPFTTLAINAVGLLLTCLSVAFVFAFILLKAYRAVDCKLINYTPVPQTDNPVDV